MLIKWLFTGLIVYALYKYFFSPNALGGGKNEEGRQHIDHQQPPRAKPKGEEEGEYIDYEELD